MIVRHGTITAYTSGKCRCDACRRANSAMSRRLRDARKRNRQCRVCGDDIAHLTTLRCEECLRIDREQPYRKENYRSGESIA